MKSTPLLHHLGQSIWLDNITRDFLDKLLSGDTLRLTDSVRAIFEAGDVANP